MGKIGAGIAALGFLFMLGSGLLLIMSLLFGGAFLLPLIGFGGALLMIVVGVLLAGFFSSPDDTPAYIICRICRQATPGGGTVCQTCGRPLRPDDSGRPTCVSCGVDNDTDATFCKACATPL